MLSKTSEYALRAVLFLARQPRDRPVRAGDVAAGLDVPANYLSKILHTLSRAGVVTSERGPRGGFRLARSADRTTLAEVVSPFDEISSKELCLLGRRRCNDDHPCSAHARWREVFEPVTNFFRETMVAELLEPGGEAVESATLEGGAHGAER
jgi:Rrf2 family protein